MTQPPQTRLRIDLPTALRPEDVQRLQQTLEEALKTTGLPGTEQARVLARDLAQSAQVTYARNSTSSSIAIDDDMELSVDDDSTDDGAYVSAWVWISGLPRPLTPGRVQALCDVNADWLTDEQRTAAFAALEAEFGRDTLVGTLAVEFALNTFVENLEAAGDPDDAEGQHDAAP
ncbi:hypothetical protein [Deinococcus sp. NW-56]|uniref:hypothetical protein n=1 Tax=Deinococcus sp. NW-56 TaxID=2080419 RepID=UPI000CF458A2|nr:hypothetical protein [Deinococcus sp. NW-56]